MQPGSGETRVLYVHFFLYPFFLLLYYGIHGSVNLYAMHYSLPDGLNDDLIIEVHDSKGKYCGEAVLQVADIPDESVLPMTSGSSLLFLYCIGRFAMMTKLFEYSK